MPVINFGFTKINASRDKISSKAKMNVDDSIAIKEILSDVVKLGNDQKAINFVMEFNANYKQSDKVVASINIFSNITFLEKAKVIDEIMDNWKKKKPINAEVLASVHNIALRKSLVHALSLSDSLGLASPVMLPKISVKQATSAQKK